MTDFSPICISLLNLLSSHFNPGSIEYNHPCSLEQALANRQAHMGVDNQERWNEELDDVA